MDAIPQVGGGGRFMTGDGYTCRENRRYLARGQFGSVVFSEPDSLVAEFVQTKHGLAGRVERLGGCPVRLRDHKIQSG